MKDRCVSALTLIQSIPIVHGFLRLYSCSVEVCAIVGSLSVCLQHTLVRFHEQGDTDMHIDRMCTRRDDVVCIAPVAPDWLVARR